MTQAFCSFISMNPKWYFDFKNKYYSFDSFGNLELHNSNDKYNIAGTSQVPYRSFIRLIINDLYHYTKVFDNVSYSGDNLDFMTNLHKFYTTTQTSSEINSLLIDKREDTYKFAIPRNTKSGEYVKILVPSTTVYTIGQAFQGGKIGYILQQGDSGYVSTEKRLIIVATSDQAIDTSWGPNTVGIGTTSSDIYSGTDNTNEIISKIHSYGVAANACKNYNSGGFTDWCLPSSGDLNSIMSNATVLGMDNGLTYLSSTEVTDSNSNIYTSSGYTTKEDSSGIYTRAVRYFIDKGTTINGSEIDIAPGAFADRMRGKYLVSDYSFQNNNGIMFTLPSIETTYRYSMI